MKIYGNIEKYSEISKENDLLTAAKDKKKLRKGSNILNAYIIKKVGRSRSWDGF